MAVSEPSKEQSQSVLDFEELKSRLREAEETLAAIRNGDVDAIVVSGDDGEKIFSLASAETPYRIILEEMNEGALVVSASGMVLYSNRRFSEMLDKQHERLVGDDIFSYIKSGDRKIFKNLLQTGLLDRTRGIITFLTAKNKQIHLQVSIVTFSTANDGQVCIVASDITELKNYQDTLQEIVNARTSDLEAANIQLSDKLVKLQKNREELRKTVSKYRQAEAELASSREKLEIAIKSGNIAIWSKNLIDNTSTWDKRMYEILGVEQGKFTLSQDPFDELIHEEDVAHYKKEMEQALRDGSSFETIFRTKPGKGAPRYVSSKAIIRRDINGKPLTMTGVCIDVTAMKEGADKAILKLNEELLRSNKDLENFAYVASHDLQEPLRMVSSFTQMLEEKYRDQLDNDARDYIKFAVDGAKRMYEMINGLLAYSRIQTKGKEFSPVNMNEILKTVTINLNLKIRERKAVITKNKLPVINADESQMIQLIQNLVENAIKFCGEIPRIEIKSVREDRNFRFSVKDNGMGIEKQYFERIFRIFQRMMPKGEFEGMGIGLAICKRIVERHNGRIWVESEPGKGSTFYFTIPAI